MATYSNGYVLDSLGKTIATYSNGYVLDSLGKTIATYSNGYVHDSLRKTIIVMVMFTPYIGNLKNEKHCNIRASL